MKKIVSFVLFLMISSLIMGQAIDTVIMKDGSSFPCKVILKGDVQLEYYKLLPDGVLSNKKSFVSINKIDKVIYSLENKQPEPEKVDYKITSGFTYCELVGTGKLFSTKVTIDIDFGEEKGYFEDTRLRNEATGKLQTFNSMVDALNYMGSQGWEFVQAYVVTMNNNQNVYHWLLKKKIK